MCIIFSIIRRVYWYLRVVSSSMFVGESSYVSFLRSSFFFVFTLSCILMFEGHLIKYVCRWEFACELFETLNFLYSFCLVFWEWDEWLSLRSSVSLSFPSLHSLTMWLHFMFDLSGSSLLFVLFISPSFSFFILIHHLGFTPCSCLTATRFGLDISYASFLRISLLVWFASSSHYWYYIHIGHPQVNDSRVFLYMLHFIHEGMGFWSLGIWA